MHEPRVAPTASATAQGECRARVAGVQGGAGAAMAVAGMADGMMSPSSRNATPDRALVLILPRCPAHDGGEGLDGSSPAARRNGGTAGLQSRILITYSTHYY
jgi:hypothetical protein